MVVVVAVMILILSGDPESDPPWQKTLTVSAELLQLWRPVTLSQLLSTTSLSLSLSAGEPAGSRKAEKAVRSQLGLSEV